MGYGVNSSLDSGDTAFMLISTAMVFIMTPGLAFFYAGLVRTKYALNIIIQNMIACCLITIQWFVIGYTLCFSEGSSIYGNLSRMFFSHTYLGIGHPLAPTIPESLFSMYQLMFAIITPALITGATADRFKFKTYCVFIVVWATLVYDPIAHQVWHPDGWLNKLGVLDFAGGIVVHASSATAAITAAIILGKRRQYEAFIPPHSPFLVILGTALLWFGWFGFNAGSALGANSQAVNAFVTTQIAAAFSGVTWTALEYKYVGKPTATGLCIGIVAGLATITPPAGFISPLPAMLIGVVAAIVGFAGIRLRVRFGYDDALDVFAVHGLASSSGVMMTAFFADNTITGVVFPVGHGTRGGWLNHHWEQLGLQLLGLTIAVAWSAVGTTIILKVLDRIPGLGLRVSAEQEDIGLDWIIHHELLYGNQHSSLLREESLMKDVIPVERVIHQQDIINVKTTQVKTGHSDTKVEPSESRAHAHGNPNHLSSSASTESLPQYSADTEMTSPSDGHCVFHVASVPETLV